jgi:2-hydroxy-3-keto-5-methylthiopentenyl-1-phosphate phosphatase
VNLDRCSVFLDFDGTITEADTGVYLLERAAPALWREIEALYKEGVIGSRDCLTRQWAMVEADRQGVEAIVGEVPIEEAFVPLVEFLRRSGAEVTIVSDGFGLRVGEVGRSMGIDVVSNRICWADRKVLFPHENESCECGRCGTCKVFPILAAKTRGRFTVMVGDGTSDTYAANAADLVFAKEELAAWCSERRIPFRPFQTLSDVETEFRELAAAGGMSSVTIRSREGGSGPRPPGR